MFQFTTTTVINSVKDLTTNSDLFVAKKDSLMVKRVGTFKKDGVTSIHKAVGREGTIGLVKLNFSGISATKGDVFRLRLYIGLSQASQESTYANDYMYKGKPFTIDFTWETTAVETVTKLVKMINKYNLAVYGYKLFTVEQGQTNSNKNAELHINLVDEFQRVKVAAIDKFDETKYNGMGEYIPQIEASETDATNKITQGVEGFGNYSYILRNLRLPTFNRTQAFSVNQDESPIPGAIYDQYTIHYCKERGTLGLNAVGDQTTSETTHVFFVKHELASGFETALNTAFGVTTAQLTVPEGKAYAEVILKDDIRSVANRVTALENA